MAPVPGETVGALIVLPRMTVFLLLLALVVIGRLESHLTADAAVVTNVRPSDVNCAGAIVGGEDVCVHARTVLEILEEPAPHQAAEEWDRVRGMK